jgi:hypothetical protein
MRNSLFEKGEGIKFVGVGVAMLLLNIVFWLALIAGVLFLLKAFNVF